MIEHPKRKQIRLSEYDYSTSGAYFVTICTEGRRCILSSVRRGDPGGRPAVEYTQYGEIAESCFAAVKELYDISFDTYVIMPNHIHFICSLGVPRATTRVAPTLGRVVGAYKSLAANGCRKAGLQGKLWQRSYYEHIIRNEKDYREIREYIENNPAQWAEDRYYVD